MLPTKQMKPFFHAERDFQYRRHLRRLQTISNDRPKVSINTKFDSINKLRQRSCQIKLQKRIQKVSYQNQVLLNKLLEISSKKSQYYSRKNLGINNEQFLPTPFTKKIKRQIDQQNQLLGSRLMQKKSQLRQLNTQKSINQYVKIKKSLLRNKQARIQPFNINKSVSVSSPSRQYQNSEYRMMSIGSSHREQMSEHDGCRVKTEPTTACLKDLAII